MAEKAFEEWAILELMGHRRLAGLVREVSIGGASFIRIDVPGDGPDVLGHESWTATQFYNSSAVYCMTPVGEKLARKIAKRDQPQPVTRWELLPESSPDPESGRVETDYDIIDDEEEMP